MKLVWIVDDTCRPIQPRRVKEDALAPGPWTPPGMVVWTPRKNSKRWHYVYSADSAEEAAQKYNARYEKQLVEEEEKHAMRVCNIRSRMVPWPSK
jgi:hypothetical protein